MPKLENGHNDRDEKEEARLDEELEETFPASDPPSIIQPGAPEPEGEAAPSTQHVRRNPVWQDQLAGLMIVGGVFLLAGVLRR